MLMKQSLNLNPFKVLRNLACSSIALLLVSTSAHALPGQSLETVRQWAKESFVLPSLVYNRKVDAYTGIRTIEGGLLALYVKLRPRDGVVTQEQIVSQLNAPGLAFTRNNAKGLKLIERIYNPQIAEDFRKSDYVAQVGDIDFYQGKQFVYITNRRPLQGTRRLQVILVSDLRKAIEQEVFCQTNSCVSYQPFFPIRERGRL